MSSGITITAFYKFSPVKLGELSAIEQALHNHGLKTDMRGLTILAPEGINGTVAGSQNEISEFKKLLEDKFGTMQFKDSKAESQPFRRWKIKMRNEIVSLKDTSVLPGAEHNHHLTPTEWNEMIAEEEVIIIDTRNTYETEIGMFKNAVDPNLKHFRFFPDFVKKSKIPKDKKVLMYCTGGIRCEKALIEMQNQGYKHVYQLQGGILQYMEEFPDGLFEGECFVFDHRTSVDKNLEPSKTYSLCPHCGDPGKEHITCLRCSKEGIVCVDCLKNPSKETCSKDCAHVVFRKKKIETQEVLSS